MRILDVPQAQLDAAATGATSNRFGPDLAAAEPFLSAALSGSRLLVIGGGGSIGSAVVRASLRYQPSDVLVVDRDENSLVEVIRGIRSDILTRDAPLRTSCLDFGRGPMARLLEREPIFDVVLNFAAVKHVRSEKDVYSLLHMLETNIGAQVRLLGWLCAGPKRPRYFSVSTDKASEPVSFMGASKRLMEEVMFTLTPPGLQVTSARFANVAFSAGSLLAGLLNRVSNGELIACPADTRRYFISEAEAASICLLALAAPSRHLLFPKLDETSDMPKLRDVVTRILAVLGYEASFFQDEGEARAALPKAIQGEQWPVLLTSGTTEGEKAYERFHEDSEEVVDLGMQTVAAVRAAGGNKPALDAFISQLEGVYDNPREALTRRDLETWVGEVLPTFRHAPGEGRLDDGL